MINLLRRMLFKFKLFMMGFNKYPKHVPKVGSTVYVYAFGTKHYNKIEEYKAVPEGIITNSIFYNEKGYLFAPYIYWKYAARNPTIIEYTQGVAVTRVVDTLKLPVADGTQFRQAHGVLFGGWDIPKNIVTCSSCGQPLNHEMVEDDDPICKGKKFFVAKFGPCNCHIKDKSSIGTFEPALILGGCDSFNKWPDHVCARWYGAEDLCIKCTSLRGLQQ